MDKKSEQRKDNKECGDVDIGVHDYRAGGKREQLNGLWGLAGKEVVGLPATRVLTNCYTKTEAKEGAKESAADIIETLIEGGPPIMNTSKPHRVF